MASRLTVADRKRIAKELTAALILLYLRGKQKALTKLDKKLEAELTPVQQTKITKFAAKRAVLIQSGTNQYLDNAPNDLPANPTPAQVRTAESDRLEKMAEYNLEVLAPFLAGTVAGWATWDTYQEHGPADQQWTLEPLGTAGCGDECDDAAAASPMSSDKASGYDMPAHMRCPHSIVPV